MGKTTRNYLNPYSAVLEKTRKKEKTGHFLRGWFLGVTPRSTQELQLVILKESNAHLWCRDSKQGQTAAAF